LSGKREPRVGQSSFKGFLEIRLETVFFFFFLIERMIIFLLKVPSKSAVSLPRMLTGFRT